MTASTLTKTPRGRAAAPSVQRLAKSDAELLEEVHTLVRADGRWVHPDHIHARLAELAARYAVPRVPSNHAEGDPLAAVVTAVHRSGGIRADMGDRAFRQAWAERCRHNTTAGEFRRSYAAQGLDPDLAPEPYGTPGATDRAAELAALGVHSWRGLYWLAASPVAPVLAAVATGDADAVKAACDAFLAASGAEGVTVG